MKKGGMGWDKTDETGYGQMRNDGMGWGETMGRDESGYDIKGGMG